MDPDAPNRRGLTGSARLLRDIQQLDQHAFETRRRMLQLTQTVSLGQLAPIELQRFREEGVVRFSTPMELFDRAFPGHYLRLVRRVRTSIIALIPPVSGIRATLSTTGVSRVVIGGIGHPVVEVNTGPQSVALTSARDADGRFEMAPDSDLLLPFEGLGVDTSWELRMPRAANDFDYQTIADVLFTIEYTALDSHEHRQQVLTQLDDHRSGDRAFSFRHQLADAWYDLHNPDQTATPMTVRFRTQREDYPANIDDPRIRHVTLYFARSDGSSFEVPVTHLHFVEEGTTTPEGGGSTTIDGIISTRRGNAGSWVSLLGKRPVGEWELALPDTSEIRGRFQDEEIFDILFVIAFEGLAPAWPN
jgi:hypothetical protein